jgi:hypothetical protein
LGGSHNNGSTTDQSFTAYAICSDPFQGYSVNVGQPVSENSRQNEVDAHCPSGDVVPGGGIAGSSQATTVNINTTQPSNNNAWQDYENNPSAASDSDTPYAICANPTSYVRPKGQPP